VFVTTLKSSGYDVVTANEVFGEATDDHSLLAYCSAEGHIFITHDKKDFGAALGRNLAHAGIVIYTDPVPLRQSPARVVRTLEYVLEQYPPPRLEGDRVWLDQWYDLV